MRPRSILLLGSVALAGLAAVAACVGDDPDSTGSNATGDGGGGSSGASSGTGSSGNGSSGTTSSGGSSGIPTDSPAAPPPGMLDSTFNNGPYVGVTLQANVVAVDAMGRIYVGGSASCTNYDGAFSNQDVAIARFDATGAVDLTWGGTGRVCVALTADGGTSDSAARLAIDGTGRLVIAAGAVPCNSFGCGPHLVMARLTTTGALDTTFGNGGIGNMTVSGGTLYRYSDIRALVIDGAQIYVAGGYSFLGEGSDAWIVRFGADGNPDTTFGANGVHDITDVRPYADLAIRAGIAHAISRTTAASSPAVVIHSFGQDGGDAGWFATSIGPDDNRPTGIFALPAGFLIGGAVDFPTPEAGIVAPAVYGKAAVAKIDNAGAKDNGFGAAGTAESSALTVMPSEPRVRVQKDGKIVITGSVDVDTDGGIFNTPVKADFAAVRFSATGQPDTTYGTNGIARPGTNADTVLLDVALDPTNDKLVVLARNRTTNAYALYRFNP